MITDWKPINTYPKGKLSFKHRILCHKDQRWVRFGHYYEACNRWYYSGTNEKTQYAQTEGDEPTHWDDFPEPYKHPEIVDVAILS